MSLKWVVVAASVSLSLSRAALALETPTRINQFDAWGAYSYGEGNSRVCYALSTPTMMLPADFDHGDIFFVVSLKPGRNVAYEPQAVMGYVLKKDSDVTLEVDGENFTLVPKGKSALLENATQERQLVAALRAGRSMHVDAVSRRGMQTHYNYLLSGVASALESVSKCG